tara:strand:- start:292 stop:561 length:270 start_codon:yes stop_codon:yes gene_type:complete
MITLSIILGIVLILSFIFIRNLIIKNEKLDDILNKYEDFIVKQSEAIQACDQRLKQVDDKGIFKSDDEIGWFFKEIQSIQEALNEFTVR